MIKLVNNTLLLSDNDPFLEFHWRGANEKNRNLRKILKAGMRGKIARTLYVACAPISSESISAIKSGASVWYSWESIVFTTPPRTDDNFADKMREIFNRQFVTAISLCSAWVYIYNLAIDGWLCKYVYNPGGGYMGCDDSKYIGPNCEIINEGGALW